MKLSRKWLSEFVDISASDHDFAEAMTMSGSKVELVERPGDEITNVVVGRIVSVVKHPNADKLSICSVDVGKDALITIVTGATNVSPGDLVPVALDNSTLPGGKAISAGELRGVRSEGMLCSVKELGLTVNDIPYAVADGILLLREQCAPGDDIRPILGLDDSVIEFEITSNRPDCLSVIGLAREAAVVYEKPLRLSAPTVRAADGDINQLLQIAIQDADLCSRYTARMVRNVHIAPSPKWMRERLRSSGVRPINNIVDITNYVMLEYGQPMHAFDFSCVNGGKIIVRRACEGETIDTLDGNKRGLNTNMLVIADESRPVGIAGVMGGANSEITGSTDTIVFESANFNGTSIRQTAIALGMRTDASSRFEKGLDIAMTLPAVERACELIELLGAGEVVGGSIDVIAASIPRTVLTFEPDKINKLLGTDIPPEDMLKMLASLGFVIDGDRIGVPSWRGDVEHYSDLAEEVARLYGYERIPQTVMSGQTAQGGLSDKQKLEKLAGSLCRGMGYSEIITYSFFSPSSCDKILMARDDPRRKSLKIINPLGEDTSVMRTTSLPSMLETLAKNLSFRNKAASLYEMATIYLPVPGGELAYERQVLTLGLYRDGADFYDLKGAVEALLSAMNIESVSFRADSDTPSYHPGRCALVCSKDTPIGVFGQIHPAVCENYGIEEEVYTAELDFTAMLSCRAPERTYSPLPRYPSLSRDIAVVCGVDVTVAELIECIRRGGGALMKGVDFFDVYTGAPIPQGKKSIAFSLTLRSDDRTLTDAEADSVIADVLSGLGSQFGAQLR